MAFEQDSVTHPHPQLSHDTAQPVEAASSSPANPPKLASPEHEHDVDGHNAAAPTAADVPLSSIPVSTFPAAGSPAQQSSPPLPPMYNTPEGKIASYKRRIRDTDKPAQRANLEALLRYYEEGGKVPQGEEELWAFDGRVVFEIMSNKSIDQLPEGWYAKPKVLDSRKFKQINTVPGPDAYMLAGRDGRVIL